MTRKIEFDDDGNIVNQEGKPDESARILTPRPPQLRTRPAYPQDAVPEATPGARPTVPVTPRKTTRILKPAGEDEEIGGNEDVDFVTGWFVILDGPGRGSSHILGHGVNNIGRDRNQEIALDFGDDAISRESHAYAAYDDEQRCFYINHGGKSNLVRHNGKPLLNMTELASGDEVRIGKTTLRFVAFCGPDFDWADS